MTQSKSRSCRALLPLAALTASLAALPLHLATAAVPGIGGASTELAGATSHTFNLVAADAYTSQPDGATLYSWGYGCATGYTPTYLPAGSTGTCLNMQTPGPTLIVTEGDTVTVTLTNTLPSAAGNTSIVFPGFQVSASSGVAGLLTQEAAHNGSVTYTFVATHPGTYSYYSGSQAELQIEMGLFGAIIVKPNAASLAAAACKNAAGAYSLSAAAYGNKSTCYDREYLFQFSEADARVHQAVDDAKNGAPGSLNVAMDPYQPQYFLVNGRSMPDDMDAPFASSYVHQPYNGNPHMHPGDLVLMRIIGQGRIQHPFHFHGNHARVLARDGNLLVSSDGTSLAGPLLFTTPTVAGQSQDQIFTWTGQGLNWDVYGRTQAHACNGVTMAQAIANLAAPNPNTTTIGLALNGKTAAFTSPFDSTTKEWCPDHGKDIPVSPPDPQAVANGLWYGGTPYLGMQNANPKPLPPGAINQNPDAGYAYMWHSHNEREITTNNVFPGGLMMMLIIDPPTSSINELQ